VILSLFGLGVLLFFSDCLVSFKLSSNFSV
jgi:hypothetical protein